MSEEVDDVWLIADKPQEKHQHALVAKELREMGIKARLVDYKDIVFPIDEKKSPKIARFIMEKAEKEPFQFALFDDLKRKGAIIVNDFVPMMMANKATSYAIWKDAHDKDPNLGFLMPETILTRDLAEAKKFIERKGKVLFKPIYSGGGWGIVTLEKDDPKLDEKLKALYSGEIEIPVPTPIEETPPTNAPRTNKIGNFGYYHLQEFVPNKNFDIRAIAVGDRYIGAFARYNEDVLHNIARGGMGCKILPSGDLKCKKPTSSGRTTAPTDASSPPRTSLHRRGSEDDYITIPNQLTVDQMTSVPTITNKVKELSELDMVGVDIMPGLDGKLYVLEWNPSFQYDMAEKVTKTNIPKHIANYIKSRIPIAEQRRLRMRRKLRKGETRPKRVLVFRNDVCDLNRRECGTFEKGMKLFRDNGFDIDYSLARERAENLNIDDYSCVIIGGGGGSMASSATERIETAEFGPIEAQFVKQAVQRKMPVLGVCLGHQILNKGFGGDIGPTIPECGFVNSAHFPVYMLGAEQKKCYKGIKLLPEGRHDVIMAHGNKVTKLGEMMNRIAISPCGELEASCRKDAPVWGVQWHPEKEAQEYQIDSPVMKKFLDMCTQYAEKGEVTNGGEA